MANNRLYLVDTFDNTYLCIAKGWGCGWNAINIRLYQKFLEMIYGDGDIHGTNLIIGTENDPEFYEKWIKNGNNFYEFYGKDYDTDSNHS